MRDVAEIVAKLSGATVQRVSNPRQEDAENELDVKNEKFKLLGLDPILLESADGLMKEVSSRSPKPVLPSKKAHVQPPLLSHAIAVVCCSRQVTDIANKYVDRCDRSKVVSTSYWNKARAAAAEPDKVSGIKTPA